MKKLTHKEKKKLKKAVGFKISRIVHFLIYQKKLADFHEIASKLGEFFRHH
jgi:hypothetical protein